MRFTRLKMKSTWRGGLDSPPVPSYCSHHELINLNANLELDAHDNCGCSVTPDKEVETLIREE
jgi:hypothetical protein